MNRALMLFVPLAFSAVAISTMAADPATQPAGGTALSKPAADPVLFRLGNEDQFTESEFESVTEHLPANQSGPMLSRIASDKLFLLYLKDHQELLPEEEIQRRIDEWVKSVGGAEQVAARLAQNGGTMDDVRRRFRRVLGRSKLVEQGSQNARDPEYLKKMFEADPAGFDGTTVSVRHILFAVLPYDTPLVKQTTRERLAKLREDIVAGKVKWEDAVYQSNCSSRVNGGKLGKIQRHRMQPEPLAQAAFALKPGEISDVFETELGFHIVQVIARNNGNGKLDNPDTQRELKLWAEQLPMMKAMEETRQRHPLVGVQMPKKLIPRDQPATSQASK